MLKKVIYAGLLLLTVAASVYAINWGAPMVFKGVVATTGTATTIADNGTGASAATSTLTPVFALYKYTCSDADGCNLTLGETGVIDGQQLCIVNVGTNTLNLADTSGVSETAGAFAAGQWDQICYTYITDRWVERSRSNN